MLQMTQKQKVILKYWSENIYQQHSVSELANMLKCSARYIYKLRTMFISTHVLQQKSDMRFGRIPPKTWCGRSMCLGMHRDNSLLRSQVKKSLRVQQEIERLRKQVAHYKELAERSHEDWSKAHVKELRELENKRYIIEDMKDNEKSLRNKLWSIVKQHDATINELESLIKWESDPYKMRPKAGNILRRNTERNAEYPEQVLEEPDWL